MGAFLGPERINAFGFPLKFTSLLLCRLWETVALLFPFPGIALGKSSQSQQAGVCHVNRIWGCWLITFQNCNLLRFLQVSYKSGGCSVSRLLLSCLPCAQVQNSPCAGLVYPGNALCGEGNSIGAVCLVT